MNSRNPAFTSVGLFAAPRRSKIVSLFLAFLSISSCQLSSWADTKTLQNVGIGILTAGALEGLVDGFSPSERAKLNAMPTEEAWVKVLTPKRSSKFISGVGGALGLSPRPASESSAREQERRLILELAQKKMNSAMPLDAFNALCAQSARDLGELLNRKVGEKKPSGPRFAIAVGSFKFFPRAGAQPDPKLTEALQDVTDGLSSNEDLQQKFALVAYPYEEAKAILDKISGGKPEIWLNPEMSNVADVAVKRYHPDDIYVLTGKLIEQLDGDYTIKYDLTVRLEHPRSDGKSVVKSQVAYLFHPTRLWLTAAQDEELKKSRGKKA